MLRLTTMLLTYMDGKTTHPNSGAHPPRTSANDRRSGAPPSWLSRPSQKNTLAPSNSPARQRFLFFFFFFAGDDDVAFSTVCTQTVSFHSPSLALLTRNICKNIFIIYKTLSITFFFLLSTYALCRCVCRHRICLAG